MSDAADRPHWLDGIDVEALQADEDAAVRAHHEERYDEALDLMRRVFERAVIAPDLPDGHLAALAGTFERMLGTSKDAVAEAITVLRRAEAAHGPTLAQALFLRTRFIDDVADAAGPAALVALLDFADETLHDFDGVADERSREALAQVLIDRLAVGVRVGDYADRSAVFAAYASAVERLRRPQDADLAASRIVLLHAAADFAAEVEETDRARELLAEAEHEAVRAPADERSELLWTTRAHSLRVRAALPGSLDDMLHDVDTFAAEGGPTTVRRVHVHGMLAEAVSAALAGAGRPGDSVGVGDRLLLRFVTDPDPAVRIAAARRLRWAAVGDGLDAPTYTAAERDSLRRAVAVFEADADPDVRRETDVTRLRWGRAEIALGDDRAGVDALLPLVERMRARRRDLEDGRILRRAFLALHIAHSALGEPFSAREALDALLLFSPAGDPEGAERAVRAEALYWRSRQTREEGRWDEFWPQLEGLLREFATDTDDSARAWAAGGLFSLWITAKGTHPEARTWALARFAALFDEDADAVIRQRNVARLVAQARDAREVGDVTTTRALLDDAVERFGGDLDEAIRREVQAARDLRALTDVLAADAGGPVDVTGPTMAEVDAVIDEAGRLGTTPAAAATYARAADLAASASNPFARVAGLLALQHLTTTLTELGDVPGTVTAAERLVLACDDVAGMQIPDMLAARVRGIRASGLLRWALALDRVGDRSRALHLYGLVVDGVNPADVRDDEHITAVSQSTYNRAVLLDEVGDLNGALAGYRALAVAHRHWPDTVPRRARLVKAQRNAGVTLERLGRIPEAADAYRTAVDLARGSQDAAVAARLVDSLSRFAELGLRAGMTDDVIGWLEWALAGGAVLTPAEARSLSAMRVAAAKQAKKRR